MKKVKGGTVYIMTNKWNSTLYTGVTSNLPLRNELHKGKFYSNSFSARYNLTKLVYFETFYEIGEAIARETDQSRIESQKDCFNRSYES